MASNMSRTFFLHLLQKRRAIDEIVTNIVHSWIRTNQRGTSVENAGMDDEKWVEVCHRPTKKSSLRKSRYGRAMAGLITIGIAKICRWSGGQD